ncbi:serine/threonine protein kinase [Rubripirellula lacrimiformis]|nr:serine/threonine-protein kinase [Rubripirellula lacrimiformis]
MGTVYLSRHQTLNRLCAIKLLPRRSGQQRFDREVQSLAAIDHPGVVTATDAGSHESWRYLVMQYVDGMDLADVLQARPTLPLGVVCRIAADAASAIAAIHSANLIHRDVKPANIMITCEGETKILDFGLAAATTLGIGDDRLTTVGDLVGTVAYAAPEQLAGHPPSVAVDWYALGSSMFRMLTGTITHPHAAQTGLTSLMMAKASTPWEPNEAFEDNLPAEIRDLIAGLLSLNPAERPGDSDAIIKALRHHAEPNLRVLARVTTAGKVNDKSRDPGQASATPTSIRVPPNRGTWKAIAGGFFGGVLSLALAGWLIEVKSSRGTVTVETDQDDAKVKILERPITGLANQQHQGSVLPNALTDISPDKLNAIYKGKTVREHLLRLDSELDIPTLVESLEAVGRVVEPSDVDLVQAMFIPARRYGGWRFGTGSPSGEFMEASQNAYRHLPEQATAEAAVREFTDGTDQSIAMLGANNLIRGFSSRNGVKPETANDLINAVNVYQSARPSLPLDRQFQDQTIQERNIQRFREDLMRLADFKIISADEIMGIRQWLPEIWNRADVFDWMIDEELLLNVDQQVSSAIENNEATQLAKAEFWLAIQKHPWPPTLQKTYVSVADEIGVEIPVVLRFQALLAPFHGPSASELDSLFQYESLSADQRKFAANFIVLYGLPLVQFAANRGLELDVAAISKQPAHATDRGDSWQTPINLANSLFGSSEIWIDRLDEIRAATTLPNSLDALIQCLHNYMSSWEQAPTVILKIAKSDSEWTRIQTINSFGFGGGMGGFAAQKPSTEDEAKAKQIAETLNAYLQKHVR